MNFSVTKIRPTPKPLPHHAGFTLIEIIMVLVLIGVMGSIGTLGISTFIKNFTTSRQATGTASAGQMAILRIAKELIATSDVNSNSSETNGSEIRFTAIHGGADRFLKFELSGSDIYLKEYADNTTTTTSSSDLLVNDVASFSLEYYDWVSDNDTLSSSPTSTWSDKEAPSASCSAPFTISSFERKYCDDDGGNRQRVRFTTGAPNYSPPYMLYYGGIEYFFCTKDGEYRASEDATGTGDCDSNGWDDDIKNSIPYYNTVYIYPQSNPECYNSYSFPHQSGDECTLIGDSADNPTPDLPATGSATLNGSRLITITLQMNGLSEPFTVSIAPRNI